MKFFLLAAIGLVAGKATDAAAKPVYECHKCSGSDKKGGDEKCFDDALIPTKGKCWGE